MLTRLHSFLAAVVVWGVVAVQPGGVTMQVEPHFGGHFKFGEWLPLRVTLSNDGPPLQVEVRADTTEAGGQTIYSTPVELPTGARKRLTLYVQPPSFAQTVRVRLMEGTRELAGRSVPVTLERNVNYLIGIVAPRDAAFAVLSGLTLNASSAGIGWGQNYPRPVIRIPLSLSDIPDRPEGLRALDALILSDVDTSELTPDQGGALQAWVEQGGRLILGGGASAARTLAGLPARLTQGWLPINGPLDVAVLDALEQFTGEAVRVPGPFAVAWPAAGRALIEHDGQTLVGERHVGKGFVNYAALDLSGSPFDAWAGALSFWEKLLTPGSTYPSNVPPDVSPYAMRANSAYYALQNLPTLELPAIRGLGGLLIVYIVLVGPVNYLVLRRLRKLAWGWVTILGLTALFSAGAFALGASIRGGDVILNQISMLTFDARGTALPVQSYVGIFSPERDAYTLSFPGRALVAPIFGEGNPFAPWSSTGPIVAGGAEIIQGEPTQARGVQVSQGALQAFQIETPLPEGWALESDIVVEGDRLRGTLVNRTGETLVDAVIVYGNRFNRVGDVPPGESHAIDMTLRQSTGSSFPYFLLEEAFMTSGPTGPSRELQTRQQLLDSYYQSSGAPLQAPDSPTLIGWLGISPLVVEVAGVRSAVQQTSLVVATLSVQYPPGPIQLPFGSLPVRLTEVHGNAGICGATAADMYIEVNSSATIEFTLPEELLDMRVTRAAWRIGTPGGPQPQIAVYDRDGQWVEPDGPELSDPDRFILGNGIVRLRLSSANDFVGCLRYELEIEGELPAP